MDALNFVQDITYHKQVPRLDLIHHLMGNGHLQATVQVTENRACRNALVVHLASPERFDGRHKSDTFTFHQQAGPELTCVGLFYDSHFFLPNPRQTACDLTYGLHFDDQVATFRAAYPVDFTITGERIKTAFNIEEEMFCPVDYPAVFRRVRVTNRRGLQAEAAKAFAFLVPNQSLFPEAHYLTDEKVAVAAFFAQGDEFLGLASLTSHNGHQVAEFPIPFDDAANGCLGDLAPSCDDDQYVRPKETYTNYPLLPGSPHLGPAMGLEFDLGRLEPGESRHIDLVYVYGNSEQHVLETVSALKTLGLDGARAAAQVYWQGFNDLQFEEGRYTNYYQSVRAGIRASVATSGKMNAAIWGYNAEWVRDGSCASLGAILSGQFDLARVMLDHILTDLVGEDGMAFGESQFYEPHRAELDQNGELIYALWMYWVHSRDPGLIEKHWEKIQKVVEFALLPYFWVEEVGMAKSERDQRDRDAERHGLKVGFELSHQMWISLGFTKGADMAERMGAGDLADRWRSLGDRVWQAAMAHPQYRLVENDYLMKRRLLDGSFQRYAKVVPYVHRPDATVMKVYPRNRHRAGELEPDGSEAWPISKGMIDPLSDLARRTLLRMEYLWNFEWDFGGYPLHHPGSEPTKLGSWPMIFYFITQAAVEAREHDTVRRNLDWILTTKDGRGFTWWEYRDADPEFQIDHGIAPWFGYGEPVVLLIHHMLGYRPEPERLLIRPHLLPEMKEVRARLRCGDAWISLQVHHGGPFLARVELNGQSWTHFDQDNLFLDVPAQDIAVELWMENQPPG